MSIAAALSELSDKRKQIEEAAREQAKAILAPGLKQFMSEHPEVKAIGWTQYTPHFNDGEPCEFGLHGVHVSASDERDENLYGDGWSGLYGKAEAVFSEQTWKELLALEKALNGAEPELQAAFGDHVRVIVTLDGIDVEEYEHE